MFCATSYLSYDSPWKYSSTVRSSSLTPDRRIQRYCHGTNSSRHSRPILWMVLGLVFWGAFMSFNRPDATRLSMTWVALAFPMGLPLVLIFRRLCRRFLPRGHDRLAWIRGDVGMILIAIS